MRAPVPARPKRRIIAAALLVGLAVGWTTAHASAGEDLGSFVATAEGSGFYTSFTVGGFAVDGADGGGPVAQSVLDSTVAPRSFASLPYPGATGVTAPGVVNATAGTSLPPYPLFASAAHPTQPEQTVKDPSGLYSLVAKAGERTASSDAALSNPNPDGPRTGSRALSSVSATADTVTAQGTSSTTGFGVGPLTIGSVRSVSTTVYRAGTDAPETKTELLIEGGRVGDVSFSFGPGGFQLADQALPVPVSTALETLNEALAPAGLRVTFHEATPITGGAVARSLNIVSAVELPDYGKGVLRIRLGGASSAVVRGEGPLPLLPIDLAPGGFGDQSGTPTSLDSAPVGAPSVGSGPVTPNLGTPPSMASPGSAGGSGASSFSPGSVETGATPSSASVVSGPSEAANAPSALPASAVAVSDPVDGFSLAAALMAAAGVLAIGLLMAPKPAKVQ